MLLTRLLTATVLIPIVLWAIHLGGLPLFALVLGFTTIAEIEFCLLVSRRGFQSTHLFGIALVWLFLLDTVFPELGMVGPGLTAILLFSVAWQIVRYGRSTVADWTGTAASGVYLGLYSSHSLRLRAVSEGGLWWTLLAVSAILVADSAAYLVGSTWGKRKLAPAVSSGKTWEGYAGGTAAGGLTGMLVVWLWTLAVGPTGPARIPQGLVLGTLIGAIAPIGDLAISMVKREAGVKDSSRLLPGHGGMLDRLDSVLWAVAIGYYYVTWFAR